MLSHDNLFWCLFQKKKKKTKRIFSETFKELVRETKTGKSSEHIPNNERKFKEEDLYLGMKKKCIGGVMQSKKVCQKVAPSLFSTHKGESVSKFRFRNYS